MTGVKASIVINERGPTGTLKGTDSDCKSSVAAKLKPARGESDLTGSLGPYECDSWGEDYTASR